MPIVLLGAGAACGRSSETPPAASPELRSVERALANAPMAFANKRILFADYAGAYAHRTGFDESNLPDLETLSQLAKLYGEEEDRSLISGLGPMQYFDSFGNVFFGRTKVPFRLSFDLIIRHEREEGSTSPTFMAIEGRFGDDFESELIPKWGYTRESHNGTIYYRLHEDFAAPLDHRFHSKALEVNRVAVIDNLMLAAPATYIITDLMDVQAGRSLSLLQSHPHRALALAGGEGLLAGEFGTQQSIGDRLGRHTSTVIASIAESHPDWGALSNYAAYLKGYRIEKGVEEFVVALYYPNPGTAAMDAAVLKQRWESPTTLLRGSSIPYPISRACSPLSTEVIKEPHYSILLGSCPVLPQEETNDSPNKTTSWYFLPHYFLYPDPSVLAQPPQ